MFSLTDESCEVRERSSSVNLKVILMNLLNLLEGNELGGYKFYI